MFHFRGLSQRLRKFRRRALSGEFYSDEQARYLAEHAAGLEELAATNHVSCSHEDTVRYMQLSQQIRLARAAIQLSPIDVSQRLRIDIESLIAIELLHTGPFDPVVFRKYCEFLRLNGYVARWIEANPETARRLKIIDE